MKFMKSREPVPIAISESIPRPSFVDSVDTTTQLISANSNDKITFIIETTDSLSYLPGRRSFKNMNAAVEKFYQAKMDELNFDYTSSSSPLQAQSSKPSDEAILADFKNLSGLPRGPKQSRIAHPTNQLKHSNKSKSSSSSNNSYNKDNSKPFKSAHTSNSSSSKATSGPNSNSRDKKTKYDQSSASYSDKHPMKKVKS